jgi:hypothetical protein
MTTTDGQRALPMPRASSGETNGFSRHSHLAREGPLSQDRTNGTAPIPRCPLAASDLPAWGWSSRVPDIQPVASPSHVNPLSMTDMLPEGMTRHVQRGHAQGEDAFPMQSSGQTTRVLTATVPGMRGALAAIFI